MGYLNNEEKTKESLDEEGWLHTGDIARIDKVGLFLKKVFCLSIFQTTVLSLLVCEK